MTNRSIPVALAVFLTFWYGVIIVPVSLAVLVGLWGLAIALSTSVAAAWLQRSVYHDQWRQFDWLTGQSDIVVYVIALALSVIGVALIWLMVKATGRFIKLHQSLLKQIWG